MRPSWTRACAATQRRLGRLGGVERLPLELLRLAQISLRKRVRPEPREGERRVVAEADASRNLERATVSLNRGRAVLPSLRRPCLEEQRRYAKRVVADRVRMSARCRRQRRDRRDVAGLRRADRADDAARCNPPIVPGRLERGGRVARQLGSALDVAGLGHGERRTSVARIPAAILQAVAASETARSPAASAAS